MKETAENRLKRLQMRSMRRGMKEMDLILMRFAETELANLSPRALDDYEALLSENDQDLYVWISGQASAPAALTSILTKVMATLPGN